VTNKVAQSITKNRGKSLDDMFSAMSERCDDAVVIGIREEDGAFVMSLGHTFDDKDGKFPLEQVSELLVSAMGFLQDIIDEAGVVEDEEDGERVVH